jgi:Flp pilus assembly protein TadD
LKLSTLKSYQVSFNSLKNNFFLGTGPDTYAQAVSQYRLPEFNNDFFWYLRFNSSGSFFAEIIATLGMLGLLSWLYLLYAGFKTVLAMKVNTNKYPDNSKNAFLAVFVFVSLLMLLYSANITFLFFVFVLLALSASWSDNQKELISSRQSQVLVPSVAVFLAVSFIFIIPAVMAEINFSGENDVEGAEKAIRFNNNRYQYYTALAKAYKTDAIAVLQKNNNEEEYVEIINKAIDSAWEAIRIYPKSVVPEETLAMIHRDTSQYNKDSELLAIEAFKEAIILEPTNPVLFLELGKMYYLRGAYTEAIKELDKARGLKDNYYNAELYLAKAQISSGLFEPALEILERWVEERPGAELYYEQGRAYVGLKQWTMAEEKLRQAVTVEPLYSNALYLLAITLETTNSMDEALFYLKKVEQLNPDNEEVRGRINRLEGVN